MLVSLAMSRNTPGPDYELDDTKELATPAQVRAMSDFLRMKILELLHERAATVSELALAAARPKSTVAHHVNVLVDAELVRVVRTRRVRAIEERYYGRTAHAFYAPLGNHQGGVEFPAQFNDFAVAAQESAAAHEAGRARTYIRHARIPEEHAQQFWERVHDLVRELDELPRTGDTVYGFTVGLYPTDYPTLPQKEE